MRVLIAQTGFLGDVILSTPVIENVHELYPGSEISFLTTVEAEPLVRYHPLLCRVITFDKRGKETGLGGLKRKAAEIQALNFDMAFALHKSYRTGLLLHLSKIRQTFGFEEAAGARFYSKHSKRKDLPHEVLRNLAIFRTLGHDPMMLKQHVGIELGEGAEKIAEQVFSTLPGLPTVGIAPGSVWLTKRWTVEGFAAVVRHFSNSTNVVILGSTEDVPIAEKVIKLAGSEKIINLTGKLSLLESSAVISKLDLLITNDSAPLHIASAFRIPVVAIFCATVTTQGFGPWQTKAGIVENVELECRPCGRHGHNYCPLSHHLCRIGIHPKAVVIAAQLLLTGKESGEREAR